MKTTKQKNLVMIIIAAAILVAVNIGVWVAASNGAINSIDNMMLWGGFVVLNVASIVWAISLLGLQPFVVSLSYVAGGALAYMGVRGMSDISVAEVTTAGATYGAFGALAIGNVTAKVRLAFFNKGQVPFIFVIVGLLVFDAVLNSGVAGANGSVILNAVILPFIIAGIVVGLIWSVLNRYGIGRKPQELLAEIAAEESAEQGATTDAVSSQKLVIEMPEHAVMAEEESKVEKVVVPERVAAVAKPAPVVAEPAPVMAEAAPVEEKQPEEEFYPLEIDKDEDFVVPVPDTHLEEAVAAMETPAVEQDSFEAPEFDDNLYASGSIEAVQESNVLVQEPQIAVTEKVEVQQEKSVEEVKAPVAEVLPVPEKVEEKEEGSSDWLGGHLDLLNKLK